jgi:hypothetical protein
MRTRPWIGAVAIVLAAALAGCGGDGPEASPAPGKPHEVRAKGAAVPIGPRVLARIPTGAIDVCSVVAAGPRLWVSSTELRSLIAVDPRRNSVVARAPLPGHPCKLQVAAGLLWAMLAREGLLVGLDPRTGRVVRRVRTEETCHWGFAATDDSLWLAEYVGGSAFVTRRSVETGATVARLKLTSGGEPCAATAADGSAWFGSNDRALHFDPDLKMVAVDAGPEPFYTVLGTGDEVWLGNHDRGEMRRLDARDGRLLAVYRFGGGSIAADEHDLWATSSLNASQPGGREPIVVRLDRAGDRVVARYRVGRRAPALASSPDSYLRGSAGEVIVPLSGTALAAGSLWVHSNAERRLYRIAP